jgi:hypothetical protein
VRVFHRGFVVQMVGCCGERYWWPMVIGRGSGGCDIAKFSALANTKFLDNVFFFIYLQNYAIFNVVLKSFF